MLEHIEGISALCLRCCLTETYFQMTAWTVAGDEEYAMRASVYASPASSGPFHNHTGIMRIPAGVLGERGRERERASERERVMAVEAFPREGCQG